MDDRGRALSALYALDPGCSRDAWVRILMAAKDAGRALEEVTDWSTPAHNFGGDRECAQVWRSIHDGPVKAATLFHLATEAGWRDPVGKPPRQYNGHSKHPPQQAGSNPRPPPDAHGTASAATLWQQCTPATEAHPYIVAKCGKPEGLRVVPDIEAPVIAGCNVAGWLVVPAISPGGELRTLQLVPPGVGKKLNFPGAYFADSAFTVGDVEHSPRLYICEGIGQAWACQRATGCASVVCFGAGRMETVAKALRLKYAERSLVLVPDRGKEIDAEKTAKRVGSSYIELPPDKPLNYDANDFVAEYGPEVLAQLLESPKAPAMRYRLLGCADLTNALPLAWLVRGVLSSHGLACIFGASGSGKSFLALDLCAAVAAGVDWFGCRVMRGPVVYAALEGEGGFAQRVKAWQKHYGDELPPTLRFVMQPFDLRKSEDRIDLCEAVAASGSPGGLLVIDTLNRAASGADENSSSDMGAIIDAAKALQLKLGGVVLLIHHSGKDQSKGLRGHSSLHAALDAAVEVTRTDQRRTWRIAKAKDDGDSAEHPFRLEIIPIGNHDDGERITSCVAVPDGARRDLQRTIPPKGGNQRVAWQAIVDLSRASGPTRPEGAPSSVLEGAAVLSLEAVQEAIRARMVCEPKRKTERAQQALTGLLARGCILVKDGFVWIA